MKKVYLVHCWDGKIEDGWYPWLKIELEKLGIKVIMENMPNTEAPSINEWTNKLDILINNLDSDTYFIGHSIGCQTIMRYLEKRESVKIGGMLFVAPWLTLFPEALVDGADKVADEWLNTPINFSKIKEFTSNITCIFSDNDYFVPQINEQWFKEKLNATTVILKNKGHISKDDGVINDPEILTQSRKMMGI